jgi:murein L,D-transpeptidase YcbB/YkuD
MKRAIIGMLVLAVCAAATAGGARHRHPTEEPLAVHVRDRLADALDPYTRLWQGPLDQAERLQRFYAGRGFEPVWISSAQPGAAAADLLAAIRQAGSEGLAARDYHEALLAELLRLAAGPGPTGPAASPRLLAELELLLSDAFFSLARDLVSGRSITQAARSEGPGPQREIDPAALLECATESGSPASILASLRPQDSCYHRLRISLAMHRQILAGGGWTHIPDGQVLKPGQCDYRVPDLRSRLLQSGDLMTTETVEPELLDPILARAVRAFQERHGLDVDGVVGPATLAALNVPVTTRIRQLELNLERRRLLPRINEDRLIRINIPAFTLEVIEHERPVLQMPVIVGRKTRPTPVFVSAITAMEFNPFWNIPQKLAAKDILPHVHEDPAYLEERQIRVFASWLPQAPELSLDSIDWSRITSGNLAFKFQQQPGSINALGQVKFMLPNDFSVYLHDTPDKHLFARNQRCFSSGCIRVAQPVELAECLMQGKLGWTRRKIQSKIESRRNFMLGLPRAVPLQVLYLTAWVDEAGVTHFGQDVYGYDERSVTAFFAPPSSTADIMAHAQPLEGIGGTDLAAMD